MAIDPQVAQLRQDLINSIKQKKKHATQQQRLKHNMLQI
jgi:hypothetical protein